MRYSSSMFLNLTVPLLSPWPTVLPLGLPHLSSPQNQSWAVCVPWSGGKLLSTSRAGQPWALHPSVHELPFLSDCTLHSSSMAWMMESAWIKYETKAGETWKWFFLCSWSALDMWTLSGLAVSVWVLCIPLNLSIWPPVYDWAKTLIPGGCLELLLSSALTAILNSLSLKVKTILPIVWPHGVAG